MSGREKLVKLFSGLKFEMRVEVMKSVTNSFEDAVKISVHVDSAIWSAMRPGSVSEGGFNHGSMPMEIGNVQGCHPMKRSGLNKPRND